MNPLFSSFMTDHRVCNKCNRTSATIGVETAYFLEHLLSHHGFYWVSCCSIESFCVVFCRTFFVLFRLDIVLSVLLFKVFCYPFSIFKLFLYIKTVVSVIENKLNHQLADLHTKKMLCCSI